jgi:ribosomal protein S18 acetylase RimI-like enzyme
LKAIEINLLQNLNDKKYQEAVCRIHKLGYERNHFSSRLPNAFLISFYSHIISGNKYSYVAIDKEFGKVLGILIAGNKTNTFVKTFIRKNIHILAFVLLINPDLIFAKLKDFVRLFRSNKTHFRSKVNMRLLNIIVDPVSQRNGIGKLLLNQFESDLKKDGKSLYGFSVKKNNAKAIDFYKKCDSTIEFETDDNIYFVKKIN